MKPRHHSNSAATFASCLLLAMLAAPCPAQASPPSPANSTVPSCISLVGSYGGVPATAAGQFSVIARDLANNPVVGARITIDISGCPDLHLCPDQLDANMTVDCVHGTASKITDAGGRVVFTLLGGSNGTGGAVSHPNAGKIFLEGTIIGFPTVSAYDLDGASGVGANDLAAWLVDFGRGENLGRSDYDCSGTVGANDFALWLVVFGSSAMGQSCTSTCP